MWSFLCFLKKVCSPMAILSIDSRLSSPVFSCPPPPLEVGTGHSSCGSGGWCDVESLSDFLWQDEDSGEAGSSTPGVFDRLPSWPHLAICTVLSPGEPDIPVFTIPVYSGIFWPKIFPPPLVFFEINWWSFVPEEKNFQFLQIYFWGKNLKISFINFIFLFWIGSGEGLKLQGWVDLKWKLGILSLSG